MNDTNSPLRSIFSEAVEITDSADRATFLHSACKGDAKLRSRVEQLLAAETRAGNFFRKRVRETDFDAPSEKMGTRIGRYRLLERIGQGGYGIVYLAEQEEPVRRQVALKVIKRGMDTSAVVARFEAERQALAVMDHPNIARVFDAGATETGRPFFVMELVRGMPITEYCTRKSLTVRERLELFIQVCNGIQHAHQKGIIHRDVKPSNILVTEHDGVPVPKVIDFGIAKATDPATEANLTRAHDFVGTPAYMSPEQIQPGRRDIDTRTDIYSLGVVLYELMTGNPPFHSKDLADAGLDELRRLIIESDPPRPSTRLGAQASPAASSRALGPPSELAALRGDVDWIVMKCLEKDRARRYETVNALATDIRRHLENETIAARPPTALYRFQKIVRRNRIAFTAIATIALVLIIAVIVSSQLALRATRAEHAQTKLRTIAEANADESRQRLIRRYVAEGNRLMEDGLPLTSLPWFVEALALEAGDPQRETDERLRIAQARIGAPELRLHLAQGNSVTSVALSPEGGLLATGSDDGLVRISSLATKSTTNTDAAIKLNMSGGVLSLSFSPDASRILAVDKSGASRLWNTATGQPLTPALRAPDFNPQSVADARSWLKPAATFSADGRFFLLAFGSTSAQLRDAATGSLLRQFTHDDVVYDAAFSSDSQHVITCGKDRTARIWETATAQPAAPPISHTGPVNWVQFSSDANKLMTVRDRHYVQLWDWRTGHPIGREIPRRSNLSHASLSPDDTKILTAAWSGFAHLYDTESSLIINEFVHGGGLVDAAFSPDARHAAIACHDGNVWLWYVNDTQRRPILLPEGNQIEQITFSRNSRFLAAATRGGHVRVWELFPPEQGVRRLPGSAVQHVQFDPTGRRALLINTREKSSWAIYDTASGAFMSTAPLKRNEVTTTRFSPGGDRILAFGGGRRVLVFDAASGRETVPPLPHPQRVREALWTPDAKLIITSAGTGGVRLWDSASGKPIRTLPYSNSVAAIALSPDGTRLATAHADKSVHIWESGRDVPFAPLSTLRLAHTIQHLQFSQNATSLAIATRTPSGQGILEIRHIPSGEIIGAPLQHRDAITSMAFNLAAAGPALLATACNDHSARVWDPATGQPISPWLPHAFEARQVAFSPDGARLLTRARRGEVRLWNARTGEPITAPITYMRNEGDGSVCYSPDGQYLLISRGADEAILRDLQPETATLEELRLRAQILSCTRFDPATGMVPLDEAGLNHTWNRLRAFRTKN